MGLNSSIEWTDTTWNPVTGCSKISLGCKNCYAERMAKRLQAMGRKRYAGGFSVTLHDDLLETPLKWVKPRIVFVNSMSDLFHEAVPEGFIHRVFQTMAEAHQHTFQVLTKRSERLASLAGQLPWLQNIWMGVTVESKDYLHRVEHLCTVPAQMRFLSLEPLLTDIPDLPLEGINWVIVGGESGPKSRLIKREWVRQIRDRCLKVNVPFFFKQWGGVNKKASGRILDGRTWDQYPSGNGKLRVNMT
jgi:protein gp37